MSSSSRMCRARVALPLLLLLAIALTWSQVLTSVQAHAGCGQHSPLAQQQQEVLRRRLQQLRANDAAEKQKQHSAGGSSSSSKPASSTTTSSGGGGGVGPRELRIGVVYQLDGVSSKDARVIDQQLVPAAIKVLQKFLQVIRPDGPPRLPKAFYEDNQQGTCVISKSSTQVATVMKDHDLSLLITASSNGCLPGMIAVATACEVDPSTKRPVLGTLNICPSALTGLDSLSPGSEAYGFAIGRLVEVVVHEIIHVLGFGANHYEDWRKPDGQLHGANNVIVNQGGRPFLATPKATKVARDYFGCPTLPGAPLENEGPSFSALSHFEYRMLQRELMSPARPIDRSRARLSAFTLAALEDSGWYRANYDDAEPLDWGRGAGCDFVMSSCWDFMDRNPNQPYFCGKAYVNQTRCTASAAGWGVCRSNGFTDSCLLVGKYSTDTSVAVKSDVAASGADGREAACYTPPQLEALQKDGSKGNLLPLLGGSFSAKPSDICYNLISQPKPTTTTSSSSSSKPGCTIPEDCAPGAAARAQVAKQSDKVTTEQGARQGRRPLATAPIAFKFYEHDVNQGVRGMPNSPSDSSRTSACVKLTDGIATPAQDKSSGSSSAGENKPKHRRALLTLLSEAAHSLSHLFPMSHVSHLTHMSAPGTGRHLATTTSPAAGSSAARLLLAASAQQFTAVVQAPQATSNVAAACTNSPVLCFRSSCDSSGQLFIEAQLPAGSSGGSSSTFKFVCPSGKTVDLSKELSGRYLLGVLQCPSNQLVCETMGCGDCSPSGGACSRGKCHCHMERFGPGCKQTLVPQL